MQSSLQALRDSIGTPQHLLLGLDSSGRPSGHAGAGVHCRSVKQWPSCCCGLQGDCQHAGVTDHLRQAHVPAHL